MPPLRPISRLLPSRLYHSYAYAPPPPASPPFSTILAAAATHIPTLGFTRAALASGAKDAGFMEISTNLFPQGEVDLVMWYLATRRLALKDEIPNVKEWEALDVRQRVRALVKRRLGMNVEAGTVKHWAKALALMAQPKCSVDAIKELGKLSDEVIWLAGDTSVDMSWYSKRMGVAGVYAAAEMYQTQVMQEGTEREVTEVERFVDRRMDEVDGTGKAVRDVSEWVGFQGRGAVNVLRSWGARI